jgi:hypothetical protein
MISRDLPTKNGDFPVRKVCKSRNISFRLD